MNSLERDSIHKQQGFTILELMIATAVFSLVLMICLAGILQITRMYYQGVTLIRTQEASRTLVDEIGESIRFSKKSLFLPGVVVDPEDSDPNDTVQFICIGSKRYSYLIDRQLSVEPNPELQQSRHVLWVDQPEDGCTQAVDDLNVEDPSSGQGGKELIGENMRLTRFDVSPRPGFDDVYDIDVTLVYGDTDLIFYDDDPVTCLTGFLGSEFCAVSNISVTVDRRL